MTGTFALLRLALRRDRILLPAWILGLAAMVSISVSATKDLYPTEALRIGASSAINATAALVGLYGRIYDPTSIGALSLIKMTAFGAALVAIVFVFVVVRHTRTEEESGRLELLSAGVVGRSAPLAAGLLAGIGGSAALGLLTALGLVGVGLPTSGSIAFGLSWMLSGAVFSAIAAVAAQVTTSHRSAVGISVAVIGLSYVLRAVGDLAANGPSFLSWLSPIGWSQQLRPFAGNRWVVVALPLLLTGLLIPLAFALRARRDLGAGLIPDRPGPDRGVLGSTRALAWRVQRSTVIAWLVGCMALGGILGSAAHNVTGLLVSPQMQKYIQLLGGTQGLIKAFLAAEIAIMASVIAAFAISATLRLRSDEVSGYSELLLATSTSRIRLAMNGFAIAVFGSAAVLLGTGIAIGLANGLASGDPIGQTGALLAAAAVQVPAIWVMASITLALFGWVPRATNAAWATLVAFVVVGEFGPLWKLPQWVLDLSPFAHSPRLPGGSVSAVPLIWLTAVAVALAAVGLLGWTRRDLQP